MDRVIGVSWPRSGHHLLVRLLTLYFGDTFLYCDFYGGVDQCCKTAPCARADIHLSKSHDFDLSLPQIPGRKYLIQYRDFIPSVVSNFELHVRNGAPDTLTSFRNFASTQFDVYRAFMHKWVHSAFAAGQLLIDYDALQRDPTACLARAVAWLDPDTPADAARIAAAVAQVDGEQIERGKVKRLERTGVHAARRIEEFRHYRPELFAALARLALSRPEVITVFREVLGRDPVPQNMLTFQAYPSTGALRDALVGSEEYARRQQAQAMTGGEDTA